MINQTLEQKTEREYFKIPFIWTEAKIVSTLLDFNFGKVVKGDNKTGLDFNIIGKAVKGDNKTGLDFNAIKGVEGDNKTGLDFNIYKVVEGYNKTGLDFNILGKEVKGNDSGINASIFYSKVGSVKKGTLSYATFYNRINEIKDYGIAVQLGFYNNVKEASDNSAVVQFGLVNKIKDNYSLFVNAKGLKNIPGIIKEAFSKKKKGLESKLNSEEER